VNVLVGICGLGHGHSLRQKFVIDFLRSRGHNILVTAHDSSFSFFTKNYPDIKVINVNIPFVVCGKEGINWDLTKNKLNDNDYFKLFISSCEEIRKNMKNVDVVLSDYEPICAWYAYAYDIPLVTMEQQSKFLNLKSSNINGFYKEEEESRLRFFFPAAKHRIAASFFKLPQEKNMYNVDLVGPIICGDILNLERKMCNKTRHILVYLSPFSSKEEYQTLVNILSDIKDIKIVVYSKYHIDNLPISIEQFRFNRKQFLHHMESASCVISSSGHQLISELILLECPMLLYPLGTFEQHYNAMVVEQNKMGQNIMNTNKFMIEDFLSNLDHFSNAIALYKKDTMYEQNINNITSYFIERLGL